MKGQEIYRFAGGVATGGSVYTVASKIVPARCLVRAVLFTTLGGSYVGSTNDDSYVDVWFQKGTEQFPPTYGAEQIICAHSLVGDRAKTGAAYGYSHCTPTSLFVGPIAVTFEKGEVMRVNGRSDNIEMYWTVFAYAERV